MMRAKIMFLLLLVAIRMKAQQDYFILIQAENSQPFYVRMADKAFSSSSGGHIILGQLKDSTYNLFIGFPRNQFPEQHFQVTIPKKDLGFVLKNMGQQGWALFNWQTAALVKAVNDGTGQNSYDGMTRRDDLFAQLMAGVVNDTAVLYTMAMAPPSNDKTSKTPDSITAAIHHQEHIDSLVAKLRASDSVNAHAIARNTDTVTAKPQAGDLSATRSTAKKNGALTPKVKANDSTEQHIAKNTDSLARRGDSLSANGFVKNKDPEVKAADSTVVAKNDDTQTGIVKNDTVPAKKNPPVAANNSLQWRYANTDVKPSQSRNEIRKLEERNTDSGREMVFTDRSGDNTDTIRISIPLGKDKTPAGVAEKAPANQPVTHPSSMDSNRREGDSGKAPNTSIPSDSLALADDKSTDSNSTVPATSTTGTTEKPVVMMNSDCHSFATDNDVDKLRVKMLGERKLDDKLGAARKIFRTRCFSAKQIRALSELFYTDESRFGFFEAAYPHVSDTENFKPLVKLLSDPGYVRRFKDMVRM